MSQAALVSFTLQSRHEDWTALIRDTARANELSNGPFESQLTADYISIMLVPSVLANGSPGPLHIYFNAALVDGLL